MPSKLRSHLYLKAVRWIAADSPDLHGSQDAPALAETPVVRLAAFLWNRPAMLVARDVIQARKDAAQGGTV